MNNERKMRKDPALQDLLTNWKPLSCQRSMRDCIELREYSNDKDKLRFDSMVILVYFVLD